MQLNLPSKSVVLVTGASGFSGSLLLKKLAAQDLTVRAIARPSSKLDQFSELPINWYRGDVFSSQTISEAAQGVDYIFHLAAAYREAGISDQIYHKVHIESTKLLAKEAKLNPNFKRFVHVSTVGVHGHIDNPPADENTVFNPGDEYQRTKAVAETWLHDFARENKLPYTVIRPSAIYGPGDRRLLKLFKMARWPFYPILGNGRCLYHMIHVDDLTDAMLLCAVHKEALAQAFIIGNSEPSSLEQMMAIISASIGSKTRALRVPSAPFFLAAAICEALCKPLGLNPPLYKRRVAFFTKDRAFNTEKSARLLGFKNSISLEEGLRQTAQWYLKQGWL